MLPPDRWQLCTQRGGFGDAALAEAGRSGATRLARRRPARRRRRTAPSRASPQRPRASSRHRAGNADDGEVAAAPRHLHESRRRHRAARLGSSTSISISSRRKRGGERADEEIAAASIQRSPRTDCARSRPPSASTIAGISEAGSACARLPPIVPRLRICGCAMCGSASAMSGRSAASSDRARGCDSASARRCADGRRHCVDTGKLLSGLMSISTAGCASRKFIAGTRLWPPARNRASSPCSALSESACSSDGRRRSGKARASCGALGRHPLRLKEKQRKSICRPAMRVKSRHGQSRPELHGYPANSRLLFSRRA